MALNPHIILYDEARHVNTKASEEYVHVQFNYPDTRSGWDGWIPVEYRRTGVSIPASDTAKLEAHLNDIYAQMHPSKYKTWVEKQDHYWNATRSVETLETVMKHGLLLLEQKSSAHWAVSMCMKTSLVELVCLITSFRRSVGMTTQNLKTRKP